MEHVQKELYHGITTGNVAKVIELMKAGANLNTVCDANGTTPLMLAISLGRFTMTRYLIIGAPTSMQRIKTDKRL